MPRRCYIDHAEAACTGEARYEARLTWTEAPVMLLCEGCAADEREHGDVIWIRSLDSASPQAS